MATRILVETSIWSRSDRSRGSSDKGKILVTNPGFSDTSHAPSQKSMISVTSYGFRCVFERLAQLSPFRNVVCLGRVQINCNQFRSSWKHLAESTIESIQDKSQRPTKPCRNYAPKPSKAGYLPYELIDQILRFLDSHPHSLTVCTVLSRHWNTVATNILYETVAPQTLRSAELLLKTLREDKEGYLRWKIKTLHLPMITTPWTLGHKLLRRLVYDESSTPILSGLHPDVLILHLDPNDLNNLSRIFSEIVFLCNCTEEIYSPILGSHLCFSRISTLRRLCITGNGTLSALVRDVLLKIGSSTLNHLEDIAIYGFNQSLEFREALHQKVRDRHGDPLLPNLHFFSMQDGRTNIATVSDLLCIFGASLTKLTLLNLQFVGRPVSLGAEPSLPNLKTFIVDISSLRSFFHDPSAEYRTIGGSGLLEASSLQSLEVRLLESDFDNRFRFTPFELFPTNLVDEFPAEWIWIHNIPHSLQTLRMVAYFNNEMPRVRGFYELETQQWKAADRLKQIIRRGRNDLDNLQLEVLERTVI